MHEYGQAWLNAGMAVAVTGAGQHDGPIGGPVGGPAGRGSGRNAHDEDLAVQALGSIMIGESPAMRRVYDAIRRIALTDAAVLISGESGTGKELAARAMHARSRRHARPFVAINCAALPSSLIASELFGYERGAFTGAVSRKPGLLQTADNGTIFLDEIGDLSLELQGYLLRFLQEGTIHPVGGLRELRVDVRVISATHVDLPRAIAAGKFREDLFYRLNVLTLHMPPLRERGNDIELLATYFLHAIAAEAGRRVSGFTPDALARLRTEPWRGNIRELISIVRRAVVMGSDSRITVEDLALGRPSRSTAPDGGTRRIVDEVTIRAALAASGQNISAAARMLGVSRMTLYRHLAQHRAAPADEPSGSDGTN
jgi:DNA-binding NtrC family response regulator